MPCVWNSSSRLHHTDPSTPALVSRQNSSWHCWRICKAIRALLPPHLASDCQLVTAAGRRHLRSSDVPALTTTPTSRRFGDSCFQSAAARPWNRLLPSLQQPGVTYRQFTRQLKSHLVCWDCDALRLLHSAAEQPHFTYLLTYLLTYLIFVDSGAKILAIDSLSGHAAVIAHNGYCEPYQNLGRVFHHSFTKYDQIGYHSCQKNCRHRIPKAGSWCSQ